MSVSVFLSVDFDADSAERLYYPKSPVKISKAQFDVNIGLERLLSLLKRYEIRTTFFVPAWVAERYPEKLERIAKEEHEIALHGYRHEKLEELDPEEEFKLLERGLMVLRTFGDIKGFRKPYWELSPNTLDILSEMGLLYDSSLKGSDLPYLQETRSGRLVELPIEDILDDWILFEIDRRSTGEVLQIWKEEFKGVSDLGCPYFPLILHPSSIGRASRIVMLENLINHLLDADAIFKRGIEIARDFLEMTGDKVIVPPIL